MKFAMGHFVALRSKVIPKKKQKKKKKGRMPLLNGNDLLRFNFAEETARTT